MRGGLFRHLIWIGALVVVVGEALGQTADDQYAPIYVRPDDPSAFYLIGEIDNRTLLNFQRAVARYGVPNEVRLTSPGGSVHVGLSLALEMHRLGVNTLVDGGCYSACFFPFMAGIIRRIEGRLGVHQIATTVSSADDLTIGQVAISDILDVLQTLGVSPEVSIIMLRTPSEDMHVFSGEEIVRFGLERYDETTREVASAPTAPVHDSFAADLQQAVAAVGEQNAIWSYENNDALPRLNGLYADRVTFYGNEVPKEQVLEEKRTFARRWPDREYRFRPDVSRSECKGRICTVVGEVDWYAHSAERRATSTGTAEVIITLRRDHDRYSIIGEDGRVISRQ